MSENPENKTGGVKKLEIAKDILNLITYREDIIIFGILDLFLALNILIPYLSPYLENIKENFIQQENIQKPGFDPTKINRNTVAQAENQTLYPFR